MVTDIMRMNAIEIWILLISVCYRYFDDGALGQSYKHMQKYMGSEYELKISRLKMEDKGVYVVRAENSFGRKEERATLAVERK